MYGARLVPNEDFTYTKYDVMSVRVYLYLGLDNAAVECVWGGEL